MKNKQTHDIPSEQQQLPLQNQINIPPQNKIKNTYIGMTLKQYFKLNNHNNKLQEIDEQSCSSVEANTPSFGNIKAQQQDKKMDTRYFNRRNKIKTQVEDSLDYDGEAKNFNVYNIKLTSDDPLAGLNKKAIKLPYINQKKSFQDSKINLKEHRSNQKKQLFKLANTIKNQDCFHAKNSVVMEKNATNLKKPKKKQKIVIRSRVTSTSFYHHLNSKDQKPRNRIKTEDQNQSSESSRINYLKSFTITRYGAKNSFNHFKQSKEKFFEPIHPIKN